MFDDNDDLACSDRTFLSNNEVEEIRQLKLEIDKLKAKILKLEKKLQDASKMD